MALATLMGRIACLKGGDFRRRRIREEYRWLADMAPKMRMEAANAHEAALPLRHEGPNRALGVSQEAV